MLAQPEQIRQNLVLHAHDIFSLQEALAQISHAYLDAKAVQRGSLLHAEHLLDLFHVLFQCLMREFQRLYHAFLRQALIKHADDVEKQLFAAVNQAFFARQTLEPGSIDLAA